MATIWHTLVLKAFFCLKIVVFSLKFINKSPVNNIPTLVWIMAWRQIDNRPLFEPVTV